MHPLFFVIGLLAEAFAFRGAEASFFYFTEIFVMVSSILALFCFWATFAGSELLFLRGELVHASACKHVLALVAIHMLWTFVILAIFAFPLDMVLTYWELYNGFVHFCEGTKLLCCTLIFENILQEQGLATPLLSSIQMRPAQSQQPHGVQ